MRIHSHNMFTYSKNIGRPVLGAQIALTMAFVLMLPWLLTKTAVAAVRITDDRGGNIGAYWSRYMALRDAGEQIIIDGTCSSACTLVLGIVSPDRIVLRKTRCSVFTPPGVLAFLASRSLMIPPHARFGTSIQCQFASGSAATAGSASQQFICPAQNFFVCTGNAADDCPQEQTTSIHRPCSRLWREHGLGS